MSFSNTYSVALNVPLINVLIILFVLGRGDAQCTTSTGEVTRTMAPSAKLRGDLMCNYNKFQKPTAAAGHSHAVQINIEMQLYRLHLVDTANVLDVSCLMFFNWTDTRLAWDTHKYQDIKYLSVESDTIWHPHIFQQMPGNFHVGYKSISSMKCYVEPPGHVTCAPPMLYVARCDADITRWPFDTHNCSLVLFTWTETLNGLVFNTSSSDIDMSKFQPNREWSLESSSVNREEHEEFLFYLPSITYDFILRRHSPSYSATIVVPALVLVVLTLVSFWIEGSDRLSVCCMGVLGNCLFLQYLGTKLPHNGDKTPLAVMFYRDSMLLSAVSLVLAIVARKLGEVRAPPPKRISMMVRWIHGTVNKYTAFSNLDNSAETPQCAGDDVGLVMASMSAPNNEWRHFRMFLDCGCFVVLIITYVVLIGLIM